MRRLSADVKRSARHISAIKNGGKQNKNPAGGVRSHLVGIFRVNIIIYSNSVTFVLCVVK